MRDIASGQEIGHTKNYQVYFTHLNDGSGFAVSVSSRDHPTISKEFKKNKYLKAIRYYNRIEKELKEYYESI